MEELNFEDLRNLIQIQSILSVLSREKKEYKDELNKADESLTKLRQKLKLKDDPIYSENH